MYLSGSPEESGAEPCLRCSSMIVLTCPSIVFTWQELWLLAHKGQALWGMLRLEFGKSNFQGKKDCNMTMKPDRNPAVLKTDCRSENLSHKPNKLLRTHLYHAMKHATKILVLATELSVGPRAKDLRQSGPATKPVLPTQREICRDFKRELTSLQALYCAECIV